jgi:hypothetical protein
LGNIYDETKEKISKVILAHNSGTKAKNAIESYFSYKNKKQIFVQIAIHDHESKISVNRV